MKHIQDFRYIIYAKSNKCTPEQQYKKDGNLLNYFAWLMGQVTSFAREYADNPKLVYTYVGNYRLTKEGMMCLNQFLIDKHLR